MLLHYQLSEHSQEGQAAHALSGVSLAGLRHQTGPAQLMTWLWLELGTLKAQ